MEKQNEYAEDDLLNLVEGSFSENRVDSKSHREEIESLDSVAIPVSDGLVEIHLSDDQLVALADFFPPFAGGKLIEEEELRDEIREFGIVYGVDWDTIKSRIDQCNSELVQFSDVVIAQGDAPVDEEPEHLVLEDHLHEQPVWKESKDPSVDYKEFSFYILVENRDTLARVVPVKSGVPGQTVKGQEILFRRTNIIQLKPGKNTKRMGDRIICTHDGKFELYGENFWVNEVLEIKGDVDYKTGNISFPADVIVNGRVGDGFKVESGGSIYCRGTLDASEVVCNKDLVIGHGIIGRKKGTVKVGRAIRSRFIENCYIEAKDSVYIESIVLRSILHTQDKLQMGKKSTIIGGKTHARNGVIACQIGTRMGIKTEIRCGMDYTMQRKIELLKEKTVEMAFALTQVENQLNSEGQNRKLIETRDKLKDGIHKLNGAIHSQSMALSKIRRPRLL